MGSIVLVSLGFILLFLLIFLLTQCLIKRLREDGGGSHEADDELRELRSRAEYNVERAREMAQRAKRLEELVALQRRRR